MSLYVTRVQLKEALGVTDDTDNGALDSALSRASAIVDGYLSSIRPGFVGFAASSNARQSVGSGSRTYVGTGHDVLWIDDASSIASVADADGTAITSTSYRIEPLNRLPKRWLVYEEPTYPETSASLWSTAETYTVTGYWGVNTVPDDIADVTLNVAVILWRRMQRGYSGEFGPTFVNLGAGKVIRDAELDSALSRLDVGWSVPGVWGG